MVELITVRDLSKMLQLSQRQIFKLRAAGRLPDCVRVGRSVRWPKETIDDWIARGCPACDEAGTTTERGAGR